MVHLAGLMAHQAGLMVHLAGLIRFRTGCQVPGDANAGLAQRLGGYGDLRG